MVRPGCRGRSVRRFFRAVAVAGNPTRSLRHAQELGARVVCAVGVHAGEAVAHRPRSVHDNLPWVLESALLSGLRFSGGDCRAVYPKSGRPWKWR
jgi:hypothetical protein